ncbi:MAG: RNA polymerase sigma factor [Candidatus Aminicenantes bacterium]|nr:RNA polymerase sigma factor [Candidatus Aminicenantes bacterium]
MSYQEAALANGLQIMDNAAMSLPDDGKDVVILAVPARDSLEDLIRRGQAGDERAIEALYYRYKTALFNMAFRYTYERSAAEDLLQEIFIKIFTHLGDVQKTETFTGWVYRIALNTCYSYLRGKRIELQKSVPLADVEGTLYAAGARESSNDVRKPLDEAIAGLPKKLKEIFLLHDVQGFKHEEIARMLGLSVGTSKSQLFKARLRLRDYLTKRRAC